jgi:hypothetical protein
VTRLRPKEILGIVALGVLLLLLLGRIEGGLWTFASLLQYGPYFIMAAMVGIFVWSFKDRFEGRMEESPSSHQTSTERLPIRRTEKVSSWAWSLPIALLIGSGVLLYEAITSWQTDVAFVYNGQSSGYTPVLTFSNALLLVMIAFAIIALRQAYLEYRYVRDARRLVL